MYTALKGKGVAPARRLALSIALLAVLALAAPPPQTAYAQNDTFTTILEINPEPSVVGQGYKVSFRVDTDPYNGVTAYGTVTVDDGEGHTCSRTCNEGNCPPYWTAWWWDCWLTTYTAGFKTLTATFVPLYPATYNGSSGTGPHQVLQANTTTTLTSSPNPSSEGQSVTFSATVAAVAPGSGTPTGSVTFYADGALLGTGMLSSGVATFSTSTLALGSHVITAEYAGDANYNGSESAEVTQSVLDADLQIIKMVKPDGEVRAGETVVYTILVDNLGPGVAYNLVMSDTMTASGSYTVQSITPDQGGSCTPATPASSSGTNNQVAIGCTLAELEAYGRWTIVVSAVANQTIDINNVASVYAELPSDPNLENNYVDGAIAVTDVADLQLVKTAQAPTTVNAGETASWRVTITNNGPSPAENVQLIDLLPAALVDGSLVVSWPGCTLGTPGNPSDPLLCNLGTLPVDGEASFTVTGDVDPAFVLNQPDSPAADYLNNDAWVLSDTFDPDNGNNRDTDYVLVVESADLSLHKYEVGTPKAGAEIHYEYQIANAGPSWSGDVTLRDFLPSQVEFLSAYVDREGGTGGVPLPCDVTAGSNTLFCPLGDIPLTGSTPILVFVNVRIKPDATGSLVNAADVNLKDTPDPNTANNSDSVTLEILYEADLSITKTSEPMKIYPGEQKVYHIEVTNNGPADAPDVIVTDTLPSEVDYEIDSDDCDLFSEDPDVLECHLGTIPAGETVSFDVSALVFPDAPAVEITNTAVVSMPYDTNLDNNMASATNLVLVPNVADLSVVKTAQGEVQWVGQAGAVFNITWPGTPFPQSPKYTTSGTQVTAGRRVRYTLTVTNNGPLAAENVVVEDRLPAGVVLYPGSLVLSQGSCETGTPGSELDPMVCGLGTLASGGTATITFEVVVGTSVLPGSVLENDAVVSSDTPDVDNSDNQASVQTTVYTWADMSVSKSAVGEVVTGCDATADLPDQVTAGKTLRYELTVQNNGASDALNVQVMDVLPDLFGAGQRHAVTFDRAVGATCRPDDEHALWTVIWPGASATGQAIICDLGTVNAGARKTFDIYVQVNPSVPEGTVIDNGALVLFGPSSPPAQPPALFPGFPTIPTTLPVTNDPYTDNNFVVQNTTVHAVADLSVRKTANPWKLFAGEQVMYEVSVTNHGPSTAHEVILDDYLPEGVLAEMVTDPACAITENGGYGEYVGCDWEVFPVGETKTFYIFARVQPEAEPGTVSNEVVVESEYAYDFCDYNDRATAPILIQGRADLKVQKFGKPEGEVRAGDELTYTVIVENLGTGYAHNVTLDDVLESDGSFDLLEVTSDRDALCDPVTGAFVNEMFLSCALSDTLEVKGPTPGSGRWMITVVVLANEPQDINNVAYVAGSDYDPDLSNNEAMAEHEITAVADLELTKEAWGEMPVGCEGETELWLNEVAAGGMVTYTLTVSNTGPSTAENVVLLDEPLPLPNLLEIDVQSITPSQGNCQTGHIVDQGRLSCNLGTIAPEESATVTFVAHVPSWVQDYTVLVNDAQAYSDMFDDNNGNDMVSNQTIVSRVADLEVVKTQDPEIALPYWDITYTITVSNLGLSDVEGVFISDTTPVQVLNPTWSCCASDDGQCDIPCEPPTCPVEPCPWPDIGMFAQADIPAGEWVIYTIEGTLDIWPCGPFTNTVQLIPPQSLTHPDQDIDPCDENNVAEAVNNPFCHFDPLVLKVYPGPDSPP